jgi:nitrile hydratase
MNGAQDLGGMMGFGPVVREPNEPVFHAEWEKRALGLTLAAAACGRWNIDRSRYARETLHPASYLTKSYYEIWIAGLEKLLMQTGMVRAEELRRGQALETAIAEPALPASAVAGVLAKGSPYSREAGSTPRFAVGQPVRTKVMNPTTHTRLPRYARGKGGIIDQVRGCFVFPDSNAESAGEDPQWCYSLRLSGRELWGMEADPTLFVIIDAFEPYLLPDE